MKKRIVFFAICILLLIIVIGGVFMFKCHKKKDNAKEGVLIINGILMDDPVTIHSKYAELPLVKVLESLGGGFELYGVIITLQMLYLKKNNTFWI